MIKSLTIFQASEYLETTIIRFLFKLSGYFDFRLLSTDYGDGVVEHKHSFYLRLDVCLVLVVVVVERAKKMQR